VTVSLGTPHAIHAVFDTRFGYLSVTLKEMIPRHCGPQKKRQFLDSRRGFVFYYCSRSSNRLERNC